MTGWTSWRLRLPGGAHIIDRGKVGCPASETDVDVDRCFTCGSFRNLVEDHDEDLMYLVCSARPRPLGPPFLRVM